jgi:hypothetical protein
LLVTVASASLPASFAPLDEPEELPDDPLAPDDPEELAAPLEPPEELPEDEPLVVPSADSPSPPPSSPLPPFPLLLEQPAAASRRLDTTANAMRFLIVAGSSVFGATTNQPFVPAE